MVAQRSDVVNRRLVLNRREPELVEHLLKALIMNVLDDPRVIDFRLIDYGTLIGPWRSLDLLRRVPDSGDLY